MAGFADLFGGMFGGGGPAPTPGLLDAAGYMDPAQYDAARRSQGMMGLWAGLLQGGGPSLEPRNFGSALGAGLTGMNKFGSTFDESQLNAAQAAAQRASVQKSAAEIEAKKKGYEVTQQWINMGAPPPGAAPAGGGTGTGAVPNFGGGGGGSRAVSSMTANADLPSEARGFLDTIAGPESGGAYNARWPGTTFSGYDDHPRIFAPGPQGPSSAAGRYQIVATTWDGLNKKYGFKDFKPETQDTAAWKLAEDTYRSRTGQDLLTALKEGKLQDVQQMLKGQWPTLNLASYGANLRKYTGGAGAGTATAEGAPLPDGIPQVPNYAGAVGAPGGGPVPAAMADARTGYLQPVLPPGAPAGGPAAPVPAPLAGAPAPAPVLTQQAQYNADIAAGRRPTFPPGQKFNSRGEAISSDLTTTLPGQQSGANIPPAVLQGFAQANANPGGANIRIDPLSGETVPAGAAPAGTAATTPFPPAPWYAAQQAAEAAAAAQTVAPAPPIPPASVAGPQFGYGSAQGAISPAAQAAAAAAQGAPPVPAAAVGPAPPIPPSPPAAAAAPAPAALAPAAAAVALPPPPAGAAPGAAPAPGPMTVTLPAPPPIPAAAAIPQAQPLPAAPETPAIPPRPQIPGVAPGAAVSPAVAARARQAQGVVLGLSMMGVHVPSFLEKEAGIEIAGRTAAAEAEARQPIELQNKTFEASLTAAQKRWDALTDQQKETLAFQRGLTKDQMNAMYTNIHEQYKSILDLATAGPKAGAIADFQVPAELAKLTGKTDQELRRDWDKPEKVEWTDADGVPHMRIASPRQLYQELTGAPPAGAPPMAGTAPIPSVVAPGAAAPGATPGGYRTGLSPAERAQLEGRAKQALDYTNAVSTEAQQAIGGRADIDVALAQAPNLNWQGPLAAGKQQFNRITQSVLGLNTEHVAAYETAQQMMGGMLRTALRASDPNPTERQQQMMLETFPTPASSAQGYQQGLRHLQGIADWKVYRQEALNEWRQTHRSDEGFKESFKYSAIPFVVARMPENERTQYAAALYKRDPKAYERLLTQMRETESKGYNYKY